MIRLLILCSLCALTGCAGMLMPEEWRTNKLDPATTIEVDMGRGRAKFHSTQEGDFAIGKAGYDEVTQRWLLEDLKYKRTSVGVMDADARRMVYILESYGMDHATARHVSDNILAGWNRGLDTVDKAIPVVLPTGLAGLKAAGASNGVIAKLIGDLTADPQIQAWLIERAKAELLKQANQAASVTQ